MVAQGNLDPFVQVRILIPEMSSEGTRRRDSEQTAKSATECHDTPKEVIRRVNEEVPGGEKAEPYPSFER